MIFTKKFREKKRIALEIEAKKYQNLVIKNGFIASIANICDLLEKAKNLDKYKKYLSDELYGIVYQFVLLREKDEQKEEKLVEVLVRYTTYISVRCDEYEEFDNFPGEDKNFTLEERTLFLVSADRAEIKRLQLFEEAQKNVARLFTMAGVEIGQEQLEKVTAYYNWFFVECDTLGERLQRIKDLSKVAVFKEPYQEAVA